METPAVHQFSSESPPPETTTMTVEEFLESDLEGYEYVKGELVPMPPKSLELGGISTNVALSLGLYVRENQKGRIYMPYTAFKVGECGLIPDIAFISTDRIPADLSKPFPIPPNLAVEIVSRTDVLHQVEEKRLPILRQDTIGVGP